MECGSGRVAMDILDACPACNAEMWNVWNAN